MDETHRETGVTFKDLLGCALIWIKDVPVIDACICDQAQCALVDEFPEHHILVHGRRLELGLVAQVEYLQRPLLRL